MHRSRLKALFPGATYPSATGGASHAGHNAGRAVVLVYQQQVHGSGIYLP